MNWVVVIIYKPASGKKRVPVRPLTAEKNPSGLIDLPN